MDSKSADQPTGTPSAPTADASRAPLVIATLLQAGATVRYGWAYWELVVTGVMPLLTALVSVLSCIVLYSGVIRHLMGKPARWSLLLAAVGLGWSFLRWGVGNTWSYPFLFGAVVGVVAWVLTTRAAQRG